MTDTATYEGEIPSSRIAELQEKLSKLNKRARRLGCTEITIQVGPGYTGERDLITVYSAFDQKTRKVRCTLHHVRIEGSRPKLGNYRLVARVQLIEDTQMLHLVPGEELPKEYHNTTNRCDHCHIQRRRNDVYIVRDSTTNEIKVVGSTCIHDFLPGVSPQEMAFYSEALHFIDAREFEGLDSMRAGGSSGFDVESYLVHAAFIIRMEGFKSKKYCREVNPSATPTCYRVDVSYAGKLYFDHEGKLTSDKASNHSYVPYEPALPTGADFVQADEAIKWARSLESSTNDYLINIFKLCDLTYAPWNLTGLATSVIAAYLREKGELETRKRERLESVHVGALGERLKGLSVTCKAIHTSEGNYGLTHIHTFIDDVGNQFTWFASAERLEEGKRYTLIGTVKKHDEFKGIKKTVLSRCVAI